MLGYTCSDELLNGLCYVLRILGECGSIRDVLVATLVQNFDNFKDEYGLQIMKISIAMDMLGIENLFLPNITYFLDKIVQNREPSWIYAVLVCLSLPKWLFLILIFFRKFSTFYVSKNELIIISTAFSTNISTTIL